MTRPILLTQRELTRPLSFAIDRVKSIKETEIPIKSIVLEGLFVLSVASLENALIDTLKVYYRHIPHKLDFKSETLSKETIIAEEILEATIENKTNSLSYKNIQDILLSFTTTLSIENKIEQNLLDTLQEIKARRNLLIHNNLFVNKIYDETAGPLKSSDTRKLDINGLYLINSITVIENILQQLILTVSKKYEKYTRLNALKNLWDYTFSTPIMKFENEWIVDEVSDVICGHNSKKSKWKGLSSSEMMYYKVWHAHICGVDFNFEKNNLFNLSSGSRQKFAYLLSVVDIFKT